ncbi:hypothetical protein H310_12532 [Aphanomyces invadans]|uniref:Uncharacterized protein n=1 Tax=Aphanomyces invadans TaxID=157072 RepID=A0A024THF8_9STRA|nr:hypothetical protein H310_12532 [Aphanomyces invadans]ETV93488.1 hypothetical protein H310_12532 [Aphanomyces invadans]|eukprot:XP_008877830.1 hypothetical protein H310_12532 [Aphanomyces invadans]
MASAAVPEECVDRKNDPDAIKNLNLMNAFTPIEWSCKVEFGIRTHWFRSWDHGALLKTKRP